MGIGLSYRVLALALGVGLVALCFPSSARTAAPALADLRAQLTQPEDRVDFAKAKLTVDRMIDPSIDEAAIMRELDSLIASVKSRTPAGVSPRGQLDILLSTLYEPGSWNGHRPFSYDLVDPLGKNRKNKLLSTYLATRKGNCVSMPILVAILGQRLGLIMTLATVPNHVLVKFVDEEGRWLNIEATAGGFKFDSSYERETGITETAIENEIYLRPLTPRESVGVIASTLMEQYAAEKRADDLLAVAEMVLVANPKDTVAIIWKANAYYLQLQDLYGNKYQRREDIPQDQQADYQRLSEGNLAWFAKAERLGWVPRTPAQEAQYLQSIQREKTRRGQ